MKKSTSPSKSAVDNRGENRRRHDRVSLRLVEGVSEELVGAAVLWPDGSEGVAFDLSYSGAAVSRASSVDIKVGDILPMVVVLGGKNANSVESEVAWFNDKMVGFAFVHPGTEFRLNLESFLNDKLIGRSLRPVDPRYFSSSLDCQVWYHGPKDTNVYLWVDGSGKLLRAEVELDLQVMIVQEGKVLWGERAESSQVQELYGTDQGGASSLAGQKDVREFLHRVVELITQIPNGHMALGEAARLLSQVDQ